jgi:hypothetical protein
LPSARLNATDRAWVALHFPGRPRVQLDAIAYPPSLFKKSDDPRRSLQ